MRELSALSPSGRIVDAVQDTLREAIFGGTLRAGDQLSVPELARQLNVSRSPVREAVLSLVAQGLAVEQPRRGVVVASIEPDDVLAIHEVRQFLEAGAARLAAQRHDGATVLRLQSILAAQGAAVQAGDTAGYFRTNLELHRAIADAAGNPRLSQMLLHLDNQMRIALHRIAGNAAHMRAGYEEHAQIVAAIAAYDADAAERAMRTHIANTMARSRA